MALQGNLRDFSATEILQLIGTQKKSGCLQLEWQTERAMLWVQDGRVVSTRQPGMGKEDSLLQFLIETHRLSTEQYRGLQTIQRESDRDLEDLLLNGRYLDAEELASYVERQILDSLSRIVRWDNGSYHFDPTARWSQPVLVSLSVEGALIEAARRVDEQKRFVSIFRDPHQLLGIRDLPDPDDPLSDEERDLFGIIDGQHTVAEVVIDAPLSEYEAYEALQRMVDAGWVEFVGRRDPGAPQVSVVEPPPVTASHRSPLKELLVAVTVLAAFAVLHLAGRWVGRGGQVPPRDDVFVQAQLRDLRYALALFDRQQGHYPARLEDLVEDRWVHRDQLAMPGYLLQYQRDPRANAYRLDLRPDR